MSSIKKSNDNEIYQSHQINLFPCSLLSPCWRSTTRGPPLLISGRADRPPKVNDNHPEAGDNDPTASNAWRCCSLACWARKLGTLPISRITAWWTTRSSAANVVMGSLKIWSQAEKTRFVVIITERCS